MLDITDTIRFVQGQDHFMDKMKDIPLTIAAAVAVATGLALLVSPSTVVWLLLGSESSDAAILMSRIAGIGLTALGVACWPGGASRGLLGIAVYNAVSAGYMAGVGVTGGQTGILWWPAFAAHGVLAILLTRAYFKKQ